MYLAPQMLKVSGALPPLFIYAFTALRGTTLLLPIYFYIFQIIFLSLFHECRSQFIVIRLSAVQKLQITDSPSIKFYIIRVTSCDLLNENLPVARWKPPCNKRPEIEADVLKSQNCIKQKDVITPWTKVPVDTLPVAQTITKRFVFYGEQEVRYRIHKTLTQTLSYTKYIK
jgi:hypothetical protein